MDPEKDNVQIGVYRLLSRLGAGGMGEVYLAEDTRLHRRVALKLLHSDSDDESSRKRLLREARAAATLDHPNICTVFDVGDADGRGYIAMQYVEGETLASRLERAPLPMRDGVAIATQIVAALDEAHRHGVIHRDVKPQNIILTPENRAKVLDFGLAQVTPLNTGQLGATTLTASGGISGTVPYMSPEQVRGETLDARTDIFSFGVVLYELLARVHPFFAGSQGGTISAILTQEPDPLGPGVPLELQRIVRKCLEKDRERRYQSMRDCLIDLESFTRELTSPSKRSATGVDLVAAAPRRFGMRRGVAGLALALVLAGAAATWLFARYRERPLRVSAADFVQLTNFPDAVAAPAMSPDGRMIAFIRGGSWFLSSGQIYVKALPDGEARQLTNDARAKYGPVFTPDGTRITYTAVDSKSWDTWSVPVFGGEPTRLLPNASGLTWIDQRRVIFSEIEGDGLHMGIATATVDRADYRRIYFPAHERAMAHFSHVSPDGKWVLVVEMDRTGQWLLPCRVVPFDGSSSGRQAGPDGACTAAAWSSDGAIMYFSATVAGTSHLWRQRFPSGTPEQITTGSATKEQGVALAPDSGSIVTSVGQLQGSLWVHETGGDRLVPLEGLVLDARLSHDGKRIYCLVDKGSEPHPLGVTVVDLASGAVERILGDFPLLGFDVSSDSQLIAFTTITTSGEYQIWSAPLDRTSPPRQIVTNADRVLFRAPRELVFRSLNDRQNYLERAGADGSNRRRVFDNDIIDIASVSPDGQWVVANGSLDAVSPRPVTFAQPIDGGAPRVLCLNPCFVGWSPGGQFLYVEEFPASTGKTLLVPIPSGQIWPELPKEPAQGVAAWEKLPGARTIPYGRVSLGPDPSTYVFRKYSELTNLFRVPLTGAGR